MMRHVRLVPVFLLGAIALGLGAHGFADDGDDRRERRRAEVIPFAISRIFIEFNASGNDLGFHIFLDAEDWKELRILHPNGRTIFEVEGKGGFGKLGMTELFFEGAEPSLDDVPVAVLFGLFPEGDYRFIGRTVDGNILIGTGTLSHAVPAGPEVSADVDGGEDELVISWDPVTDPAEGFVRPVTIVGYQVIVEKFQVTVPASITSVTVTPEFVASLSEGEHPFEVLAIDESGNQSITEGTFTLER